ncbi:hypothetical protein [Delftia lacustris]|uniref:Uncharacterized protein n=1 Tax=Delftia lacustris TaxID=558537 RepID=A0A1H3TAI3_9BURK|nr:hypothetical protein [Delftia lacustris]SDZ47313.1 hypothetical protein SAMN05421547_1271 [Delftia lacustris]
MSIDYLFKKTPHVTRKISTYSTPSPTAKLKSNFLQFAFIFSVVKANPTTDTSKGTPSITENKGSKRPVPIRDTPSDINPSVNALTPVLNKAIKCQVAIPTASNKVPIQTRLSTV